MKEKLTNSFKNMSRKTIIGGIVCAVCLLLFAILTIWSKWEISGLQDQQTHKRWVTDGSAGACVSVFIPEGRMQYDERTFMGYEHKIAEAYYSLVGEEKQSNDELVGATPLASCVSCRGTITLSTEGDNPKTADSINAIGVAGEFFLFHPLHMLSGSPFSGSEDMKDSIVLDEYTAFRLFGSADIEGQLVMLSGIPYTVRGVYKMEENKMTKLAEATGGFVFVPIEALGNKDKAANVTCMEYVCVEAYTGFLKKAMKEAGISSDDCVIVENSSRYGFANLWSVATNLEGRAMQTRPIIYPYWENVARGYEVHLAGLLMVRMVLMAIVIVWVVGYLSAAFIHRTWGLADLIAWIYDLVDKRRVKKRDKKA